jgi:hypothetical protein
MARHFVVGLVLFAHSTVAHSSVVHAQAIPQHVLGAPLGRSADGYTDIVRAHELRDGRVLAVDLRERRIVLLDFRNGSARAVSREGAGPKEYTGAFTLIPWLGDSVLVYGRRDFLKIAPNGEPVTRVALDESLTRRPGGLGAPRFADRAGRIYFEAGPPLERTADGRFIAQIHGTLVRWNVRTNAVDTIGAFLYRDPKQPLVSFWRPYPAKDGTAVLPDGRAVFVRAVDYRVEIWGDGARVVEGPRVPYTPLPITRAERDAFRDDAARRPRGTASATTPAGQPVRGADRDAARRAVGITDDAFPPRLPAIVDERATLVDPVGRIWVARSFAASSTDRAYDVFDDHGELKARVMAKRRGRIVGFGPASVYVATPDEDDVEWIERYAMPAIR